MIFNRRKFIKRLLAGIAALEAIYLVKGGINKSSVNSKDKELFNAGSIDNFSNGKTYPFLTDQFFLRRFEDGGFLAMSIKCTHLGCVVNQDSNGFACPCHASKFNKYGEVMAAPATRPLDLFPVSIENGEVFIDTSKPFKRTSYLKSQLTYA